LSPETTEIGPEEKSRRYKEISLYFLSLGMTGFGGPLALIAEMQKELVERRQWISLIEFRQVFAAIKSMPGPVAFQVAQYLGTRYNGRLGGLLAATLLLLPATVLMILLAIVYENFQQSQDMLNLMQGFQMGALVLIALAVRSLVTDYVKDVQFWTLAALSTLLLAQHLIPEVAAILMMGFGLVALEHKWKWPWSKKFEAGFSLLLLMWICFKAGAFVFGTGLAMVPLLERDFVVENAWLTRAQFMDALAFGQLTPGPVSVTVTFVGYKLGGLGAALLATVAIFLPAAIHQATWFPRFVGWLTKQDWVKPFVKGATAAIVGGILVSIWALGQSADHFQLGLFALTLIIALKFRLPGWLFILGPGLTAMVYLKIFS
jgi:chromate transporter